MAESHRPLAALAVGVVVLASCSGSDGDATELVDGFEPVAMSVTLPAGGKIEADATSIVVRPQPAADPSREVEWDGLVEVASALSESGVDGSSCLQSRSIRVNVEAPDDVFFVVGAVCDDTPEADAVVAALAPISEALGTEVLDLENGRTDQAPDLAEPTRVSFFYTEGSFPDALIVDVDVTENEAVFETQSGTAKIALTGDEFERFATSILTADLPEDDSQCIGGPVNGVTVAAGDDTLLRISNNPCETSTGFDALNDAVQPLLDRVRLTIGE